MNFNNSKCQKLCVWLALLTCSIGAVFAQTAPGIGSILQQVRPGPTQPTTSPSFSYHLPPLQDAIAPGGPQLEVLAITFTGNTVIDNDSLTKAVGLTSGARLDLAGLHNLAARITQLYQALGYPFASAQVPEQTVNDGVVRLDITEGRYGQIQPQSTEPELAEQAQPFLSDLQSGEVIYGPSLERASLILSDLPGIGISPVISPGSKAGTGDLEVQVSRASAVNGSLGLDNYGNRYSGQARTRGNLSINSPFALGDQINLSGLYTQEDMWLGNANYSRPLGGSGLRATLGYATTSYKLGKEFASLSAYGTAKINSAGLTYPWLRSQQSNVNLNVSYQHSRLNDNTEITSTHSSKSSETIPLSLLFDHRDSLGQGGVTYGNLTWTSGKLYLDSTLAANDSGQTRGSFKKVVLDVSRVQNLPESWSLFTRLNRSWAGKNLDSSENFSLGGPTSVRAYPVGEAPGDQGFFTQVELRYGLALWTPFLFYDMGRIKVNAKPELLSTPSADKVRAGGGIGVRYADGQFSGDALLSWRSQGGTPQADTSSDPRPRLWVSLNRYF
ncbi:hypothetical protein B9Z41_02825 [Limnohabitans sp. JirII-31]|nr:hypothetical protein B9Z41_02825 [Limnohabitans sp. JirII-31]